MPLADIHGVADLQAMARIFGICTGSTHRDAEQRKVIFARLDGLSGQLVKLSDKYMVQINEDYQNLKGDPRAAALAFAAKRHLAEELARPEPAR